MGTLLVVALHSKPSPGTLSSQIGRGEWSLLVVAKRLAASVKGPTHYSLPFTEPKHPFVLLLPSLCTTSFFSLRCSGSAPHSFPKSEAQCPHHSSPVPRTSNIRACVTYNDPPAAALVSLLSPHPRIKRTFICPGHGVATRLPSTTQRRLQWCYVREKNVYKLTNEKWRMHMYSPP